MPRGIKPMLCTLLKRPFNAADYLYEVKWDGYRLISYKNDTDVRLSSRGGHDYTAKYPSIVRALEKTGHSMVIDGEAIVLNREGKPDFDALQKFNGQMSGVFYYVFDILWIDGRDLMKFPLIERKKILKDVVYDHPVIRYSDHFEDGIELFRHAESMKLEGIIAKQKASVYAPGHRGKEWYKIPTEMRQEFVIGGWIESDTRPFRTLLFGAYEGDGLRWIGHAGGGFKDREMPGILRILKALEVDESPFVNAVEYEGVVHWVKPEKVANIKYATVTRSGKIRKPAIFLGFRDDKEAREVISETPSVHSRMTAPGPVTMADSNWPLVEAEIIRNTDVLQVEECPIQIHNVDRELWKGITKARLIQYYHTIAPYLLPHIKDRPLSLHLKLNGPFAPGAYIKDMEGRQPECASIFTTRRKHPKAGKRDVIDYLVCNNKATLLYTIDLGCIDVNPWTSTVHSPTKPDYIIIDLDPSDQDFAKAVETALAAKAVFDERKIKAFAKTSGQTGIHLYVPCTAFTFPQARRIAERISEAVHQLVPAITTTEVAVSARGTKLYLDPNQNDYADTVAAPYCVRPYRYPTVSTPLSWREIKASPDPAGFTIDSIEKRLKKTGDLFDGLLDVKTASRNDKALKVFL